MGGGGGEAGGEAGPARPGWLGGGCSWHRLCLFFREWPPLGCGVAAPLSARARLTRPWLTAAACGAGGGAGRGRSQGGASAAIPTPLGLPPPAPPTLHPFPQRIGRRPAGAGALGPPPLLPFARPVLGAARRVPVGPQRVRPGRASGAVPAAGPPYSQTCCLRISRPLLSSRRPPLKSARQPFARGRGRKTWD